MLEKTNSEVILSSETVVKKRPGGVLQPETILFAEVMKTAKLPKVPIRDKKPPIITLFIYNSSQILISRYPGL